MPQDLASSVPALVVRALAWLIVTALLFVPLEAILPVQRRPTRERDLANNLGWFFVNSLVTLPAIAIIFSALAWLVESITPHEIRAALSGLPLVLRLVLAMIIGEFGFYWGHRWSHEWPWLWRFHSIHHSPSHMHYLVNTRMHPVDMIFTRGCGVVLLVVFGLATTPTGDESLTLPLVLLIGSAWSYFVHANVAIRLGPLEKLISTPSFHHWHHAYSDNKGHNFASMLPVYDMIFGTFHQPAAWPKAYGTDMPVPPHLTDQLAFPFAQPGADARADAE